MIHVKKKANQDESLRKLRRLIVQETDIYKIFNSFFDLVDSGTFDKMGQRSMGEVESNPEFAPLFKGISRALAQKLVLNQALRVTMCVFFEVPGHDFYHGLCQFDQIPFPITVIYSRTENTALMALAGLNNQTEMFRLTLIVMPEAVQMH